MKIVGRIEQLWRHPVKSMRGERAAEAHLRWTGLAGDRRYAFVRSDEPGDFPWLTGRVHVPLLGYAARFDDPADPRHSPVRVRCPDGRELAVDAPELLRELTAACGGPAHLVQSSRGLHDAAPVSLIGAPSIEALCGAQGLAPDLRRFRGNLVVVGERGAPFEEEQWLGKELVLGEAADAPRIRVDRRNKRCVMITRDPQTLDTATGLLTALAAERESRVGLYASVVRPGALREGASIFVARAR